MGSKDYYGTRSMQLYQWSLRQELKAKDFYEEKIGPVTESVESALEDVRTILDDTESFLNTETSKDYLESDRTNDR